MSTSISPILQAKQAYISGKQKSPDLHNSIRETAKKYHVAKQTLGDRICDHSGRKLAANEAMQRLSRAEKVALCYFVQTMGIGGFPPSVAMVKRMAEEMAFYRSGREFDPHAYIPPFGLNWMVGFKRRNPGIKAMYTRARDVKQSEGTKPEHIQPFYTAMHKIRQRYRHPASAIFNMDKTGFEIGNVQRRKGVIYCNAAGITQQALQAKHGRGKWVTSIECISAEGKVLVTDLIQTSNKLQPSLPNFKLPWSVFLAEGSITQFSDPHRTSVFYPEP